MKPISSKKSGADGHSNSLRLRAIVHLNRLAISKGKPNLDAASTPSGKSTTHSLSGVKEKISRRSEEIRSLSESYEAECLRIHESLIERSNKDSDIPPFFFRKLHAVSDALSTHLFHATKCIEISLSVNDVTVLDCMHLMLKEKMSAMGSEGLSIEQFTAASHSTLKHIQKRFGIGSPPRKRNCSVLSPSKVITPNSSHNTFKSSSSSPSPLRDATQKSKKKSSNKKEEKEKMSVPIFLMDEEQNADNGDGSESSKSDEVSSSVSFGEDEMSILSEAEDTAFLAKPWYDATLVPCPFTSETCVENEELMLRPLLLDEVSFSLPFQLFKPLEPLYVRGLVPHPRLSAFTFISSRRSESEKKVIPASQLNQTFTLACFKVKSALELAMWDTDHDGWLSEDEIEIYIKEMTPHIETLRTLTEVELPFYCCTVCRRIFWDLDVNNRSAISIDALLQSSVLNQWLQVQLLAGGSQMSWFDATATRFIYEKFLLLDSRKGGTLRAEDLKVYKKGLPTLECDGLPADVSPLSSLFIDRYFETTILMPHGEMDYRKFVDFVIAVEMLPQCSRPRFFWNILDIKEQGYITPMIVNCFFRETFEKVKDAIPNFQLSPDVVVRELFDMIPSAEPLLITREEFLKCSSQSVGLFIGIIVDCLMFWGYERRPNV